MSGQGGIGLGWSEPGQLFQVIGVVAAINVDELRGQDESGAVDHGAESDGACTDGLGKLKETDHRVPVETEPFVAVEIEIAFFVVVERFAAFPFVQGVGNLLEYYRVGMKAGMIELILQDLAWEPALLVCTGFQRCHAADLYRTPVYQAMQTIGIGAVEGVMDRGAGDKVFEQKIDRGVDDDLVVAQDGCIES